MVEVTTIKIMKETKLRLDKLKEFDRESYDQILRKMLYVLNMCRKTPEKSRKFLEEIDKSIKREQVLTKDLS
jgi:hypothetical protein